MKIQTRFTFDKVKHDQDNDVHLVVSLKAPKTDWQTKRPPICLTLVCDVSGSMGGDKLEYAKKSIIKMVEHLQPGDYCGLVTFTDGVYTLFETQEVTQTKKDELIAKAQQLAPLGSTNFSGGLLQGLELANKRDLPKNCVNRVVLLTDGIANCGVATEAGALLQLLGQNIGKATVSAFGYGTDADQELLSSIAKQGKGNYAFIRNPDEALSAFAKELGGLLSTYAQDIVIEVAPHNGHRVTNVVSDVDVEEDGNNVKLKLTDILAEEERHVVLAMKLSKQTQALPRAMNVADIKVSYSLLEQSKKTNKSESFKAKIHFVKDGEEQTKATEDVDKLVALAEMVKGQAQAEIHARAGDFAAAGVVLNDIASRFDQRGLTAHANITRGTRAKMASHAAYTANAGYLASMSNGASRSYGTSSMDHEAEEAIRGLTGDAVASPVQDLLIQSFIGEPQAPAVGGVPIVNNQPAVVGGIPAAPAAHIAQLLEEAKKQKKEEKKSLAKKRSGSRW